MKVDPAASMRCWAIPVQLGPEEFEIPALPAADWWPVIVGANPGLILDLFPGTDGDRINDLMLSGEVTMADLGEALGDVIEEVTGRSLHVAAVLAIVADAQWVAIGGRLAREGFRWDVQPIGAALDAVHSIILEVPDKEFQGKFSRILENEVVSGGKRKIDRQKMVSDFETMAGPRPAPVKATAGRSGGERPRTRRQPRPPRPDGRSGVPTPPPGPPAGSDPAANSAGPGPEAGPASDTVPPPHLAARKPQRSRVAGRGAGPAPTT